MHRMMFVLVLISASTSAAMAAEDDYATGTFHLALADAVAGDIENSRAPLSEGSWTWQAYGSGTMGLQDGDIYLIHAGVGYHLLDNFSLNVEVVAGSTDTKDRDGNGGTTVGFDVLLRWHFLKGGACSVYLEGGAGMIWFNDEFPGGGTHQNFTPQLGVGLTVRLTEQCRLMAGVRWHHVSNAGKSGKDRNPGYDGVMGYAGLMFPF